MTVIPPDVDAALLYRAIPQVDFDEFAMLFEQRAGSHGLTGSGVHVRPTDQDNSLCLAIDRCNMTMTITDHPLAEELFDLPMRAPILKHKDFDFAGVINTHRAGIVIAVKDCASATPAEAGAMPAGHADAPATDYLTKLAILHAAMQSIASMHPPLMIDFRPSRSLLTPVEFAAVASAALPVPILFHPFPIKSGPDAKGNPRCRLAAIYAQRLIGAELELKALPEQMPMAERLDLLAGLLSRKIDGELPLEDGDTVTLEDGISLQVRHEKGSGEDGPQRIVAAYDGPPARPDHALSGQNQTSFQERIERLKTRARPDVMTNDLHVPPVGGGGTETKEELRARVRDTLNPDAGFTPRSGLMKGPMKLVIAMSLLCGFFLFGPTSQISDMVTDKGSTIQSVKNLLVSPEMAISTSVAPGSTNMVRRIGQSTQAASDP